MQYQGVLTKMQTELDTPIQYYLVFDTDFVHVNQLLNKRITIDFVGYQCKVCGQPKKIFRQGFCYEDFYKQAQAGDWIMRPELSTAHLGVEDRDLAYEKKVQLQPHIVYLANSSGVKVGVTRKSQIPTRWIDQGAHEALAIAELPNRYLAGITEVALKARVSDKTNWRKMLKNEIVEEDLSACRDRLKPYIPEEVLPYFIAGGATVSMEFPVTQYPTALKSLNLDKTPTYEGVLKGIKGQYLIFEDTTVFNVRNWEGYVVCLTVRSPS